jgi:hypothetical protein
MLVLLIGGVYEIGRSDDFEWHDVHTKFYKIISVMLKFLGVGTPIRTQPGRRSQEPIYFFFFQIKESRLKIKKNDTFSFSFMLYKDCSIFAASDVDGQIKSYLISLSSF